MLVISTRKANNTRNRGIFVIFLVIIVIVPSLSPTFFINDAYAQNPPSVSYFQLNNSDTTWVYNDSAVSYKKEAGYGLRKMLGPDNFQDITISYLQANEPTQSDLTPASQGAWSNAWQSNAVNMNNWFFFDNYAFSALVLELQRDGDNYDSVFFYDIRVNLITKEITVNRVCIHCNTTGIDAYITLIEQMSNYVAIFVEYVDTDSDPDDIYLYYAVAKSTVNNFINTRTQVADGVGANGIMITKSIKSFGVGLYKILYNSCISAYVYSVKIIATHSTGYSTIYESTATCDTSAISDPTFESIDFLGRAGNSVFVEQDNTKYKCELVVGTNVISSFTNCIVTSETYNTGLAVSNPAYRYDQLVSQNSIIPHVLFNSANTFSKGKWFIVLTQNSSYAIDLSLGYSITNLTLSARNLFAEVPGSISNDPSKLGGIWKIRKVDSTDQNNVVETTYNINAMFLTNRLEINTLLVYLDPASSDTIKIFLDWQITYNNETKTRTFDLELMKDVSDVGMANIDISDSSITLTDVTVVFTDPNLANIDMYVKLQGHNVFVDTKKTAPDKIKFFAVEGNCYQIYKRNQAYTWLANVCAVPPYQFAIGPTDGREGNILIGIYWWPQWYVTHIYYKDTNTVDVIIHKTPPFTYKIKILSADNSTFYDENFQTGNNDPLTRTFTLGSSDKYKLMVIGKDNNRERIVYTADITKSANLQFFLPFSSYGINAMLIIIIVSMLIWTKNNVNIGIVLSVIALGIMNYLGFITINDSLFMLLITLAGIALIISKRMFS